MKSIYLNTCMSCSSSKRCNSVRCARCSIRYAARLSRRIATASEGPFLAVTLDLPDPGADFHRLRVSLRNVVDHQRRASRWWRSVGLWVWLGADGRLTGLVAVPQITTVEFQNAFARRWSVSFVGAVDDLRHHIAMVVAPSRIAKAPTARYQHVKFSIWPARPKTKRPKVVQSSGESSEVAPMPLLL